MKRRAWTLVETMVALGLFSLVGLVIFGAIRGTLRLSTLQSRRASMQAQLLTSASRLEQDLQRATSQDVVYSVIGQVAVLAVHCRKSGQEWEAAYRCYLWEQASGRLLCKTCPPSPPTLTVPRGDRPQLMSAADLSLLAASPQAGILLAEGVSDFQVTFLPGPLVRFRLELKRDNQGGRGQDKQSVIRELAQRNRI